MLTEELYETGDLYDPEPPLVVAMRMLCEPQWEHCLAQLEGGMKFFNPEQREFSSCESWAELAESYGMRPFDKHWRIDPKWSPRIKAFCRDLRSDVRRSRVENTQGQIAFVGPIAARPGVMLTVTHARGCLVPYFSPEFGDDASYRTTGRLLAVRGLWRWHESPSVTHILAK